MVLELSLRARQGSSTETQMPLPFDSVLDFLGLKIQSLLLKAVDEIQELVLHHNYLLQLLKLKLLPLLEYLVVLVLPQKKSRNLPVDLLLVLVDEVNLAPREKFLLRMGLVTPILQVYPSHLSLRLLKVHKVSSRTLVDKGVDRLEVLDFLIQIGLLALQKAR